MNPVLEPRFTRANQLVFEGLVGLSSSLEPVPVLAESVDSARTTASRITFKLRKGVRWHDGKPFTSKDVAFTIRAHPRHRRRRRCGRRTSPRSRKLDTPDAETVVVTYAKPYAPALIALDRRHPAGPRLRRRPAGRARAATASRSAPARSGWPAGSRQAHAVRGQHRRGGTGGRTSTPSSFGSTSGDDQLKALKDGQLDFAQIPDVAGVEPARCSRRLPRPTSRSPTWSSSLFRAIAWNTQRKPFDDKRVRLRDHPWRSTAAG